MPSKSKQSCGLSVVGSDPKTVLLLSRSVNCARAVELLSVAMNTLSGECNAPTQPACTVVTASSGVSEIRPVISMTSMHTIFDAESAHSGKQSLAKQGA